MIVVSIFGGLGSQMDQYSFYLGLKKHYPDTQFKFSLCNIVKPDHNGYELGRIFGIFPEEASFSEIMALSEIVPFDARYFKFRSFLGTLRRSVFGYKDSWIIPDDPSAFYKEVFELNPLKNYLFFGNWSNEKYRQNVNDEIYEAFKFPKIEDTKNLDVLRKIESSNSVSIHVRRGDYIKYGYPMLSLNYYKKAVEIIREKNKEAKFFVFSNDVPYVKDNFDFLNDYEVVDVNSGCSSYKDMQLMSHCKHNIIANSTFSYWGARLNRNPNAVVVCPKYHVPQCKHTASMPNWVILDNHVF